MIPVPPSNEPAGRLPLADILPALDYRHRLKLQRGDAAAFFGHWDPTGSVLKERARWLGQDPRRYSPALPEADPLVREAAGLMASWGLRLSGVEPAGAEPAWGEIGVSCEPDLILLTRDEHGARMVAGSVCFPSSWAPETKLGLRLREIHAIVPSLNSELGAAIDAFLERLQPGPAWLRANWGLAASAELNQHPCRQLPRLQDSATPSGVWLRLEHQALVALPSTRGILFGIRVEQVPLTEILANPPIARALSQALETLPETMAQYKGLGSARRTLIAHLRPAPGPLTC